MMKRFVLKLVVVLVLVFWCSPAAGGFEVDAVPGEVGRPLGLVNPVQLLRYFQSKC